MPSLTEPEPSSQTRGVRLRETAQVNVPLNARPNDVVQGNLAGCPIVAMLVALAHTRTARLNAMLGAPQAGDVFSKRRRDRIYTFWTRFYYDVTFPGRATATRISGVLYHQDRNVVYARLPGGAGWPSLLEKAYAVWRGGNSYDRLDLRSTRNVPDGGDVVCDLAGRHDMADISGSHLYTNVDCTNRTSASDRALRNADILAMAGRASRRPTIAASRSVNPGHGIVANHAYAVLGRNRGNLRLRNPHGGAGANVTISRANFMTAFQAVWQAY